MEHDDENDVDHDKAKDDMRSAAVAMREMDLSVEDATELRRRLDHPGAGPARTPRDVPATDDGRPSMKDCWSTYPGFVVTCEACSSGRVILEHTLGLSSSETVGPWSEVRLRCISCGAQHTAILP